MVITKAKAHNLHNKTKGTIGTDAGRLIDFVVGM